MRVLLIIFISLIYSCSTKVLLNENNKCIDYVITGENFIEVRLDDGKAGYGFTSINLTYDGLIYRDLNDVQFLSRSKINKIAIVELQIFLNEIDVVHSLSSALVKNQRDTISFQLPKRIIFTNSKREMNFIEYKICNEEIEKIITLLESLIPIDDRGRFIFGRYCR